MLPDRTPPIHAAWLCMAMAAMTACAEKTVSLADQDHPVSAYLSDPILRQETLAACQSQTNRELSTRMEHIGCERVMRAVFLGPSKPD